jgi:hypothetical protein
MDGQEALLALQLDDETVLALGTLNRLPDMERQKIEDYAEVVAKRIGVPLVDAIVLLMKLGQYLAENPGVKDANKTS